MTSTLEQRQARRWRNGFIALVVGIVALYGYGVHLNSQEEQPASWVDTYSDQQHLEDMSWAWNRLTYDEQYLACWSILQDGYDVTYRTFVDAYGYGDAPPQPLFESFFDRACGWEVDA